MSTKSKSHTPRKPRPSELAAKAARAKKAGPALERKIKHAGPAVTRGPGRPPEERKAFDKTTMVRMHADDYAAFESEAAKLARMTGASVSVGAYLRMAGRAMLGKHPL